VDQRSDDIRQDIESTRASLDSKLDTLESKARQTLDVKHHVAERLWMALGAAVAAGYVLGSLGSGEGQQRWNGQPLMTTDYNQHARTAEQTPHNGSAAHRSDRSSANSFMAQFDDEIALLKTAAITTLTSLVHDVIKEYVPALGQQLDQTKERGKTPATAPGTSRY